jgi:hypothetical protein
MTMTIEPNRDHGLRSGATRSSRRVTLGRVGWALLAAIAFGAWIAALPALLASAGFSWRSQHCGRPGYREPVTGRAAGPAGEGSGADCRQASMGSAR